MLFALASIAMCLFLGNTFALGWSAQSLLSASEKSVILNAIVKHASQTLLQMRYFCRLKTLILTSDDDGEGTGGRVAGEVGEGVRHLGGTQREVGARRGSLSDNNPGLGGRRIIPCHRGAGGAKRRLVLDGVGAAQDDRCDIINGCWRKKENASFIIYMKYGHSTTITENLLNINDAFKIVLNL